MKTCPSCRASYHNALTFCPKDGQPLQLLVGFEPGLVIRSKYQVVSEIARGGFAIVYRVRHLMWGEDKAIKLLLDTTSTALQNDRGFQAEAKVMRQLNHPNIVRIEDIDYTDDGQLFIVMEYIEGESLRQRLKQQGPFPFEQAMRLSAQACEALATAHGRGIIHRDIKPQNMLLVNDQRGDILKLIDFGISKVREEAGLGFTGVITGTTGVFVGTPEYASPEQALGVSGSDLDPRSDLYSLGIVLFEMIVGKTPFAADTPLAVLMQRLISAPPTPQQMRRDVNIPDRISSVIMKSIAKDKEQRYGSAEEMKQAILQALDDKPSAAPTASTVPRGNTEKVAADVGPVQPPDDTPQHRRGLRDIFTPLFRGKAVEKEEETPAKPHSSRQFWPAAPDVPGENRPEQQPPLRGADLYMDADLSFEEALTGKTLNIEVSGKALMVKVPPGVDSGTRLRLAGQGSVPIGTMCGPRGDLYIVMKVGSHPLYHRKDTELFCTVEVAPEVFRDGGIIEIPPLGTRSPLKVRIQAGAVPGTRFRLRGQGVPILNSQTVGDLCVLVQQKEEEDGGIKDATRLLTKEEAARWRNALERGGPGKI